MDVPRMGALDTTPMGAVTAGLKNSWRPVELVTPSPYGWAEEGSDGMEVPDGPGL